MSGPAAATILVTGAAGFVGRHVVAALAEAGYSSIRCLAHRQPALQSPDAAVTAMAGDVCNPDSLDRAMEGVSFVVHLVAIIREGPGGVTFQNINHRGTANVVEAARKAGVQHLVHLSAIGAGPDEHRRYRHTKWLAEQEVESGGVPYTILRPSIIFGPGDEFLNTLAAVVKLFPIVPEAGSGQNRFQPIAAQDVARCVASTVAQERYLGRTIEFGGPRQYTYDELLRLLSRVLGARRAMVRVPVGGMRLIAGVMELLLPRPPVTREQLKYLDIDNVAELDSVEREFGFAPQPLEENLGYVADLCWRDALAINAGFMPRHIRDH